MKLPEFEFGPVQESSSSLARVDQAQRQAAAVVGEGIGDIGRARIKVEQERAVIQTGMALRTIEDQIRSERTIPAGTLKQLFGGALPKELETRLLRDSGGTFRDDSQVPMYLVADDLYAHATKQVVEKVAAGISDSGWRQYYKDNIQGHIEQRKGAVSEFRRGLERQELGATELQTVRAAIDLGDFGLAESVTLEHVSADERVKAKETIAKGRAFYAANVALQTNDVPVMKEQLELMRSKTPLDGVDATERDRMAVTLQTRIRTAEAEAHHSQDDIQKANEDKVRRALVLAIHQRGEKGSGLWKYVPTGPDPQRGGVSAAALEHFANLIEATIPKASDAESDPRLWSLVVDTMKSDDQQARRDFGRDGVLTIDGQKVSLDQLKASGLVSPKDFITFQRYRLDVSSNERSFQGDQEQIDLELTRHGFPLLSLNRRDEKLEADRSRVHSRLSVELGQRRNQTQEERNAFISKRVPEILATETTRKVGPTPLSVEWATAKGHGRAPSPEEVNDWGRWIPLADRAYRDAGKRGRPPEPGDAAAIFALQGAAETKAQAQHARLTKGQVPWARLSLQARKDWAFEIAAHDYYASRK